MNVIGHHYRAVQREARSAWRLPRHTRSERSCGLPRAGPSGGAYRTLRKCLYCRSDSAEGDGGIRRFASCRTRIPQRCCTGEDARAYIVAGCFKVGLAKTMMRRNHHAKNRCSTSSRPNPSSLDVAASVSPQPIQSRCRRERLARAFKHRDWLFQNEAGEGNDHAKNRCSRKRLAPTHPVSM